MELARQGPLAAAKYCTPYLIPVSHCLTNVYVSSAADVDTVGQYYTVVAVIPRYRVWQWARTNHLGAGFRSLTTLLYKYQSPRLGISPSYT